METQNSRMGIFGWLVGCQGLVKGTGEHGCKCETVTRLGLTFVARELSVSDSSSVL